jgi:hypothetical protein
MPAPAVGSLPGAAIIQNGQPVSASGFLIRRSNSVGLCSRVVWESSSECDASLVPVALESLPSGLPWRGRGSRKSSEWYELVGRWENDRLVVTDLWTPTSINNAGDDALHRRLGLPCDTPAGGWKRMPMMVKDSAAYEKWFADPANQARYSARWGALSDGWRPVNVVLAAPGHRDEVAATLSKLFKGPLCVAEGHNSNAARQQFAESVRKSYPQWFVANDAPTESVIVSVPAYTDAVYAFAKTAPAFASFVPVITGV